jgi:hypothetical protein
MTVLADLIQVTFIYDTTLGSPIETQPLGGKVVAVPPTYIPLPDRGTLLGQPGFSRQTATAWEWVMQGANDPLDQFVDSLTGLGFWVLPASRTIMKSLCQAMFNRGFTKAQIQTQMPQLYQAIINEKAAE